MRNLAQQRIQRAQEDVRRYESHTQRGKTAEFHLIRYEAIRGFFENELRGDVLRARRQ